MNTFFSFYYSDDFTFFNVFGLANTLSLVIQNIEQIRTKLVTFIVFLIGFFNKTSCGCFCLIMEFLLRICCLSKLSCEDLLIWVFDLKLSIVKNLVLNQFWTNSSKSSMLIPRFDNLNLFIQTCKMVLIYSHHIDPRQFLELISLMKILVLAKRNNKLHIHNTCFLKIF